MANDAVEATLIGDRRLYFSYGQFMAYDRDEDQPGSLWDEGHVRQGFVRRPHSIGFGTLVSYGHAELRVYLGAPANLAIYDRVVCVPIEIPSGELRFEGPEEYPINRMVRVTPGKVKLCVAQKLIDDDKLGIDVFVNAVSFVPGESTILKADEQLQPGDVLIETGNVAQ